MFIHGGMTKLLKFKKNLNPGVNPDRFVQKKTKSSLSSKYGKMKIYFFKILGWIEYFYHKEASMHTSFVCINAGLTKLFKFKKL